jgi:type IV pilus assembly protein PilA
VTTLKGGEKMKRFIKKFRYSEKGFTLIELLVVVAILGVLAAIAVPNVGKFLDKGHKEAKNTELHNIQTAVMAAMADGNSCNVSAPGDFGNVDRDLENPTGQDIVVWNDGVDDHTVGEYLVRGASSVQGDYLIATDGTVTQEWYPGDQP